MLILIINVLLLFYISAGIHGIPGYSDKAGNLSCVNYLQMSGVSGDSMDTLAEGCRWNYPWMSGIALDIL